MTSAKPDLSLWLLLIFLGLIWGGSFPASVIALTGFSPLWVAALRITLAAVILLAFTFLSGRRLPETRTALGRRVWLHALGMAIFTNALPFSLLSWGQLHVSAGFAGITMAVVPLVVLPLAHFLIPGDFMTKAKLAGFASGFIGVVVLIGPGAFLNSGADQESLARLTCLGAAGCYAIGSIITRLSPPFSQVGFGAAALTLASLIIVPVAFVAGGAPQMPDLPALAAVIYLGLIPTALATVILVHIIEQAGPSFMSLVNYQVPVWAAVMGVAFLSEALPGRFIGALALILAGLAISQRRQRAASAR